MATHLRVAAVCATTMLTAGAALAETSFDPPLASPTPLSEAVYIELKPGAMADCVGVTTITDGPQSLSEQRQRTTLAVSQAPDGVRLEFSEQSAGITFAAIVGDDGQTRMEDSPFFDQLGDQGEQMKELFADLIGRSVMHKISVNQDDAIIAADELDQILGPIITAMSGPGADVSFTGGQYVTGESLADGRRVLVHKFSVDGSMPLPGGAPGAMRMFGEGVGAFDIATGLLRYDAMDLTVELPLEAGIPPIQMRLTNECTVTGG